MATVKLYLNHPKKNGIFRKDEVSVKAVILNGRGDRFEVPTGEKITPKHWDSRGQCVKTTAFDHVTINQNLQALRREIINTFQLNKSKSFGEVKAIIRGKSQKKTLTAAFAQFIAEYQRSGKDYKTIQQYQGLENHVKACGGEELSLDTVSSTKFYKDLRDYFIKLEDSDSTFFKNASRLKTFLRWCKSAEYGVREEFEGWEIRDYKSPPLAFTEEELERLEKAILPNELSIARDYFVIACRTGLRISDLKKLDVSLLRNDHTLQLRTSKKVSFEGGKLLTLHFAPGTWSAPALNILQRHGGKLPPTPEPILNANLKLAAAEAKIKSLCVKHEWKAGQHTASEHRKCDVVTLHWGKKTFITVALEKRTPIKNVAEMTATTMNTIEKHYAANSSGKVNENLLKEMVKSA